LTPSFKQASPNLKALLSGRKRPLIMGIINVTPDSFYPGSRFDEKSAILAAEQKALQGADLLDVGGQSTRPGSEAISLKEELSRVIPVVEAIASRMDLPVSVDTDKAEVARRALDAGASIVNDVSALRGDPKMIEAAKKAEAVILMHRLGDSSKTMQDKPVYKDVVAEVKSFLAQRKEDFTRAGGEGDRVWLDVGIGFGKTLEHNLTLLKSIEEFAALGPVVLGVSRKSFLGKLLGDAPVEDRLEGSLAVACWASLQGVKVLRVHDVAATRKALDVLSAVSR
jgi:dihydropteroate synthase